MSDTHHRTLILNASYEPHCIVPTRDAVVLLLMEKADTVVPSDVVFHSQYLEVQAPAVAVLRRYVKVPFRAVPLNTRNVLARDNWRCGYCLGEASTMDHIVPRSRNGAHSFQNVVASCKKCNEKKNDSLLEELGWQLHITPYRPLGLAGWLTILEDRAPEWEPFLIAA